MKKENVKQKTFEVQRENFKNFTEREAKVGKHL